jgi:lipopolysaccharide assembly outer membrane protein LptD (OstA)
MRLLAISFLCLLCFSVSAQDHADRVYAADRVFVACAAAADHLGKCWGPDDFARGAHVGDLSPGGGNPISVTFAATAWQTDPTTHAELLRGKVEIHTAAMVLEADEADYQRGTGEIKPRGNVHVKLTPPR